MQAVGKSNEHLWAPGTLTLTAETALAAWVEIGLSVARAGLRKIVIVNSHGGNLDLVSILSRELRVRAGMLAVKCQWTSFGTPDGLYPARELAYGIHGGDMETSLMLAFRPETVDMAQARDFVSSAETGRDPADRPGQLWLDRPRPEPGRHRGRCLCRHRRQGRGDGGASGGRDDRPAAARPRPRDGRIRAGLTHPLDQSPLDRRRAPSPNGCDRPTTPDTQGRNRCSTRHPPPWWRRYCTT